MTEIKEEIVGVIVNAWTEKARFHDFDATPNLLVQPKSDLPDILWKPTLETATSSPTSPVYFARASMDTIVGEYKGVTMNFPWRPEFKFDDFSSEPPRPLSDPAEKDRLRAELLSRLSESAFKYAMDFGSDSVLEARPRKPRTQLPPPDPTSITAAEANDFLATLPKSLP